MTLLGQDFMTDRQTVMKWSGVRFWRDSIGIHVIHLKLQIGRFCFSNREND